MFLKGGLVFLWLMLIENITNFQNFFLLIPVDGIGFYRINMILNGDHIFLCTNPYLCYLDLRMCCMWSHIAAGQRRRSCWRQTIIGDGEGEEDKQQGECSGCRCIRRKSRCGAQHPGRPTLAPRVETALAVPTRLCMKYFTLFSIITLVF